MTRHKLPRPTSRAELELRQEALVEGFKRITPMPRAKLRNNFGFQMIARAVRDLGRETDSNAPAWVKYGLQEYWRPDNEDFEHHCDLCELDPDTVREHAYYAGLLDFLDPVPEVFDGSA
ncbi:hypothetical protein [Halofilum ochraceum]|uniref:hypothetical protein n=1 Tax=Halofilum ochraceum TaxID=1611323 RepID=UPI0008D8E30B|nr:hypothetical protein [Halofilum ochraceum]